MSLARFALCSVVIAALCTVANGQKPVTFSSAGSVPLPVKVAPATDPETVEVPEDGEAAQEFGVEFVDALGTKIPQAESFPVGKKIRMRIAGVQTRIDPTTGLKVPGVGVAMYPDSDDADLEQNGHYITFCSPTDGHFWFVLSVNNPGPDEPPLMSMTLLKIGNGSPTGPVNPNKPVDPTKPVGPNNPPAPTTTVDTPPTVATPAADLQARVAAVKAAVAGKPEAVEVAWYYVDFADTLRRDSGIISTTALVREQQLRSQKLAFGGTPLVGKYPGLGPALTAAFTDTLGLDDQAVTAELREKAAKLCEAIAWACLGGNP